MGNLVFAKKEFLALGKEFGMEKADLKNFVDKDLAKWYEETRVQEELKE